MLVLKRAHACKSRTHALVYIHLKAFSMYAHASIRKVYYKLKEYVPYNFKILVCVYIQDLSKIQDTEYQKENTNLEQ